MKKFTTVFILLVLCAVGVAVWFSPFAEFDAKVYRDNVAVSSVDGICYAEDACVRYDTDGDENRMYAILKKLRADVVFTAAAGDVFIVYAYSDRVCGRCKTADGKTYNVMAAYRNGNISVGAPTLQGSY